MDYGANGSIKGTRTLNKGAVLSSAPATNSYSMPEAIIRDSRKHAAKTGTDGHGDFSKTVKEDRSNRESDSESQVYSHRCT